MSTTEALRAASKWLFVPLGLFVALAVALSLKHGAELREQLRAECRTKYALAHNRGDSLLADNWIPAPGLQPTRGLRHCRDLGATERP